MSQRRRKPDFLIVGAPKCATTSLWHYLNQHPDVFVPEDPNWKEPNFFGKDQWIASHRCIRDETEYLNLFSNATDTQIIGEATPSYLHSRTAAQEIKEFNPKMRIIVSLREPVDLVVSLHLQNLVNHNDDLFSLEEALAAEADRIQGKRIPKTARKPPYLEYFRIIQYAENLERYFQAFGRENVLVLFFDDIKSDLQGTFQRVLNFLEVSNDTSMIDFSPKNESKSKDLRNWKIRGLVDYYPNATKMIRKIIPQKYIHVAANAVAGFATHELPTVSEELREKLKVQYKPEVEKLSSLLEKDLSHWC